MEVLEQIDLMPQDAIQIMTDFAQDPFLSDRDPDRARIIQQLAANFARTVGEIEPCVTAKSPRHQKRRHRIKDNHEPS
jgi:hypothetical protein